MFKMEESKEEKKAVNTDLGEGELSSSLCGVAHLRTINVIITPLPEGDLFFPPKPDSWCICAIDSLGWVTLCCACLWWVFPECCRILNTLSCCVNSKCSNMIAKSLGCHGIASHTDGELQTKPSILGWIGCI